MARRPHYIRRLPSKEGDPTLLWSRKDKCWIDEEHLDRDTRIKRCAYPTFEGARQARMYLRSKGFVKGHALFEVGVLFQLDQFGNDTLDS